MDHLVKRRSVRLRVTRALYDGLELRFDLDWFWSKAGRDRDYNRTTIMSDATMRR